LDAILEPSLLATDLVRSFGTRRAVNGVSLALAPGDCLALFGPNGAGKTTLLRLLGGLLHATSGTASIEGVTLPGGADVRARVGLVSHQTMLYEALTARENIEFAARMYGVSDVREATSDVLARLGATSFADVRVRSLSRGMQQRVSVARAIVHNPSVLLADEPFTGLDAQGASALTAMLAELRDSGATIVIVTHNLDEALALCTTAAIMREGRFVRLDHAPIPARDEYNALYRELSVDAA
jgi:heme exporter protein A